jgi:polygalacturonase
MLVEQEMLWRLDVVTWTKRYRRTAALCAAVLLSGAGSVAWAQDARTVVEPKIPPVCVRLEAKLLSTADANGGSLKADDEAKLDSERIQKAMDGCGVGRTVELAPAWDCKSSTNKMCKVTDNAFLTGPLELRDGVTLLVDKGVTLFASRDPKVYEIPNPDDPKAEGKCGTSTPRPTSFPTFAMGAARPRGGCRALISVNNVKNAAIMGDGVIDGRGYAKLIGKDYSWWEMARKAQPNDDLYYSIRMIVANHADGFVMYRITLHNSANYHVSVGGTNGFTAWGVHLQTPVDKGLIGTDNDARNTDGIDPGGSQNITVAHSWIDNGDDNIAVKQGVSHMSVLDNHFYTGHGMSIGSETVLGQSFLLVDGLTEDHTTSGIRIKSNVKRGGPVHDLVYKNICMRGVPIPIAISPYYTNQTVEPFEDPKYAGDKIPDYKRILLENVFSASPGDVLIAGLDDAHRTEVSMKNVFVNGLTEKQVHLAFDDLTFDGTVNPVLVNVARTVKTVTVKDLRDPKATVADPCAAKFVPMR